MSTSEIIEYEGRRFVRTGEFRIPQDGEWYWSSVLDKPLNRNGKSRVDRELLRELPAETPAQVTCHFPFIPGKTPNGQDKIPRTCSTCGAYPVSLWEDDHGLLAEAEEVLARLIEDLPIKRDWFDPALESRAKAVLARIRAAKEKQP